MFDTGGERRALATPAGPSICPLTWSSVNSAQRFEKRVCRSATQFRI
jgi:hypothetical protein